MAAVERLKAVGGWLREPPALVAIGFNLVPAVCVLLFGWSPAILLLLYWAENVVIGVFQIFRMLVVGGRDGVLAFFGAIFGAAFFAVHYGLFCLAHGLFVLTFLGFEHGLENTAEMPEHVLLNLSDFMDWRGFLIALAAIVALQAVSFGQWLLRGEWRSADEGAIVTEPYGRIVALHLSLFAAAFGLAALNNPVTGVFALAIFKSVAEGLFAGRKARRARQAAVRAA